MSATVRLLVRNVICSDWLKLLGWLGSDWLKLLGWLVLDWLKLLG